MGTLNAYIFTEDSDILFNEYRSNNVSFKQPIQEDDGLRSFKITDADGYVFFSGDQQ